MIKKSTVVLALAVGLIAAGSAQAGGNTLAVQAACALNGTNFGLCINMVNGGTNGVHVQDNTPNMETTFRANLWIAPNGITMPADTDIVILRCSGPLPAPDSAALILALLRNSSNTTYRIRGQARNNPGSATNWARTNALTLGDVPRNIEIQWKADSSPGAADGFVTIRTLHNAASQTNNTPQNDQHSLNRCNLGAVTSIDGNAVGQFRLDQYSSFR